MKLLLIHAAGLLYIICALLPDQRRRMVAGGTLLAWVLHAVSLADAVVTPDHLRLGFAVMLSAALWISVGAYWVENRNLSVDGLRRMVLPTAALTIVLPVIFRARRFPWPASRHCSHGTSQYPRLPMARSPSPLFMRC